MSKDVVNLTIGLPIILGSVFLTMGKKLIGLLLWPGALFFILYNYLIYVLAMPFNLAFLLDLTLVTLSLYTTIALIACIDGESIKKKLSGKVHEKRGWTTSKVIMLPVKRDIEMNRFPAVNLHQSSPFLLAINTLIILLNSWPMRRALQ